ncbi:hypothetical protein RJT34_05396 [Clitoria ternatea]|uniref:Aminotransferase class V domain-containing protein n=1 Tax=Clitoria ternatea TaxID=43366 RepID=A0AAN9PSZ6_CLITE
MSVERKKMYSPCAGEEASQPCYNACFPSPNILATNSEIFQKTPKSSVRIIGSSHDLEEATHSTLHPHTQFTNPEALPSLDESYLNFTKAYPLFDNTSQVDQIRAQEYNHLNPSNICFDYIGHGLFSYAQDLKTPCPTITSNIASTSSCPPPTSLPHSPLAPPFFAISYKPATLHSQTLYGGQESELESKIRERIMAFMNISEAEYIMVFIANEISAFKHVANSFQFHSDGELLTVHDHRNDAIDVMIEACREQGVHAMSAEFSWPSLRIRGRKLKKMIMSKRGRKKRGLFVFPLHSSVTGTPYSYVWMSMAQENGWHVLLDARAFGPKEMDTLGLTLFKPDFMICSFHKVFGQNPSGFGCLFIKKASISALKESTNPSSIGIIGLFPALTRPQNEEIEPKTSTEIQPQATNLENSPPREIEEVLSSEIVELNTTLESTQFSERLGLIEIECRGLDHADSVGLMVISCRARYLINWLVNALMSLQHPHPQNGLSLIRIYGPKINSYRGPVVAFNVFDWKGEKVDPSIVQKLADRNNISLSGAILQNLRFYDRSEEEKQRALESRVHGLRGLGHKAQNHDFGISVMTAAIGFLTNFEDVYRLWAFLSRFLDADFVEKERWRYMRLNQKTVDM